MWSEHIRKASDDFINHLKTRKIRYEDEYMLGMDWDEEEDEEGDRILCKAW
jgi:hypothetical protein